MKKTIVMALALALVLGIAVGGTLAWLVDTTPAVTNTFVAGDVEITLKESPYSNGEYGDAKEDVSNVYPMIPGTEYKKDPTVAVAVTSEDCYLFVKFEEEGNPRAYITYTSTLTAANGWTQGDGNSIPSNVWYREVPKTDTTRSWKLLVDDKITINTTAVTKDSMTQAAAAKLVYTAYAVQKANVESAAEAWAIANPTT